LSCIRREVLEGLRKQLGEAREREGDMAAIEERWQESEERARSLEARLATEESERVGAGGQAAELAEKVDALEAEVSWQLI